MKKFFLLLTLLTLTLSLFAGGSNETASQAAAKDQILVIGADSEPAGIDPHKSTAFSSVRITLKIYDSLVRVDENMSIVPSLAESWDVVDPLTYVFHLRKGVKFHNGREMTAADVKFSYDRFMNPENACIAKSYFKKVSEVLVVDDYTVKFLLSEPYAPLLSYMTSIYASIIPREVLEENGDLMQVACGTGPFMLDEWIPDNKITLKKNPDYYEAGLPRLDEIVFMAMPDESSRLAALRTGAIQLTTLGSENIPLVQNNKDIQVISYQSKDYTFLGFNMNIEPFNDIRVRQAMSFAVDREELAKIVFNGDAVVSGCVPPAYGQWAIDVEKNAYFKQDLAKAKALMKEAGYENGFDMEITVPSSYPQIVGTAQVLIQQFAEIGINATIKQVEMGQYIDAWKKTDHQVMGGLNGSGVDADRALSFFFNTTGSANVWGFSDARFDELTNQAVVETDEAKRVALYKEAQERLYELCPNLFFNAPMKFYFARSDVKGFAPTVFTGEDLRFTGISE